jgi:hypothetical protein
MFPLKTAGIGQRVDEGESQQQLNSCRFRPKLNTPWNAIHFSRQYTWSVEISMELNLMWVK